MVKTVFAQTLSSCWTDFLILAGGTGFRVFSTSETMWVAVNAAKHFVCYNGSWRAVTIFGIRVLDEASLAFYTSKPIETCFARLVTG